MPTSLPRKRREKQHSEWALSAPGPSWCPLCPRSNVAYRQRVTEIQVLLKTSRAHSLPGH